MCANEHAATWVIFYLVFTSKFDAKLPLFLPHCQILHLC